MKGKNGNKELKAKIWVNLNLVVRERVDSNEIYKMIILDMHRREEIN